MKESTDEQFHHNLYNQLYVIETHYHEGKFVDNHVRKIVNSLEVTTDLMWEHLAYNEIRQYFASLVKIARLTRHILKLL